MRNIATASRHVAIDRLWVRGHLRAQHHQLVRDQQDAVRVEHDREGRVLAEVDPAALGQALEFPAQHRLRPVRAALAPFGGQVRERRRLADDQPAQPRHLGLEGEPDPACAQAREVPREVVGLAERRLLDDGGHRREKPVEHVVDNREEQRLLAAEVVVDRLARDARLGDDLVHAGVGVAAAQEHLQGRVADRVAFGGVPVRCWHRSFSPGFGGFGLEGGRVPIMTARF